MSTASLLPSLALMDGARHVLWGIVLVWAVLGVRQTFWRASRRTPWLTCAAAIAAWTLWPGPASPAYWLGLAFQSPSLTTGGLCLMLLGRWHSHLIGAEAALPGAAPSGSGWVRLWLAAAGVALGWLLLLDTLALTHALWPASIYAMGFAPWPLWVLLALGVALWVLEQKSIATIFIATGAVFTMARVPTGNIFDAVIDPWLWVVLHGVLAQCLLRRRAQ